MKETGAPLILRAIIVGISCLVLPFTQAQQSPSATVLTVSVSDVLAMRQAGISDDIVIAKIQRHNQAADLSTEQLIELKKAQISDVVIRSLIDPTAHVIPATGTTVVLETPGLRNVHFSGATPGSDPRFVGDANDPMTPHDSGIYILAKDHQGGGKMIVLERTAYQGSKTGGILTSAMTYGIAKVKIKAVIPGSKATLRIDDANPVFYFYFDDKAAGLGSNSFGGANISNPNQFALIKLNVDKKSRSTEIGQFSMWGGSAGTNEKATVGFKSERVRPGLYKITVAEAMKPGEYCFVASAGVNGAATPYGAGTSNSHDLFDFGLDTL